MEGSHKYFKDLVDWHANELQKRKEEDSTWEDLEYVDLTEEEVEWYKSKGCQPMRQPMKKGGMILWDSRLAHQGAPPKRGRQHPGRWRFVNFVCMGPAAWATEKDIETKKRAYQKVLNTAHWPSRDVVIVNFAEDAKAENLSLPDVALTDEARKLAGVLPYDFNDGQSNGPPPPQCRK